MSESTMPATEAVMASETELASYEFAYHVLPTVAEGEVSGVSDELKKIILGAGGEIFDEEAAERFELAYEIEKYLEGRYRHFSSAYFGWIRFRLDPAALAAVTEAVESNKQLLRHLIVRLTKTEEANPFRFHPALAETKTKVTNIEEGSGSEDEVVENEAADIIEGDDVVVEDKPAA